MILSARACAIRRALTVFLVLRRLATNGIACRTHDLVASVKLLLNVVANAIPEESENSFVDG